MTPRRSSNAAGTNQDNSILYQIDCCNAASGKTVCATKRRVRWRFGTTNQSALENGAVGVECRGRESDILFSWSITSGKRMIVQDNKEVHYSQGKRAEGKFSFVWSADGRMFTLVAYAAPPVQKTHRMCGKQFLLLIDNIPFDSLPRMYELGMGMRVASAPVSNSAMISGSERPYPSSNDRFTRARSYPSNNDKYASGSAFAYPGDHGSYARAEGNNNGGAFAYPVDNGSYARAERRSVQDEMTWARTVHTMETNRQMNSTAAYVEPSSPRQGSSPVIEQRKMNTNTAAAPAIVDLLDFTPSDPSQDLLSETVPISSYSFAAQPQQVPAQYDEFSPRASAAPSHASIWSSIMDAYDTGKMNQGSNYYSAAPSHAAPVANTDTYAMQHQSASMNQVQYSMQSLYIDTFSKSATSTALVSPTEVSAIDGAMKKLVNMDDIGRPVLQAYSRNTKKNEWEGKENLPLSSLKSSVPKEKKPVMRTYETYHHHQQQQPGALVVYGQQHGQQQGPPPLSFGYTY
jgi:hypothetical protein